MRANVWKDKIHLAERKMQHKPTDGLREALKMVLLHKPVRRVGACIQLK